MSDLLEGKKPLIFINDSVAVVLNTVQTLIFCRFNEGLTFFYYYVWYKEVTFQNLCVAATELWKYNTQWLKKLQLFSNEKEYDDYFEISEISIQKMSTGHTHKRQGDPSPSTEEDVHSDHLCIIGTSVSVEKQVA